MNTHLHNIFAKCSKRPSKNTQACAKSSTLCEASNWLLPCLQGVLQVHEPLCTEDFVQEPSLLRGQALT